MREFIYYLVSGGEVLASHLRWMKKRQEQETARVAFEQEFGATGCYANDEGVKGLVFNTPPEGWQSLKGESNVYLPPKGKAGALIRKRMKNLPLSGAKDYHYEITGPKGGMGFFDSRPPGVKTGFSIRYIVFEQIGNDLILLVPKCPEGEKWTPPDDGCKRLLNSQYWFLKEARK